ncbi:MAG: SH3 domain-containing protein [Azospirillaceae bacterium]|nr:SH3 domain-containing protein [Azospirillaceae bacterium]
MLGSIRCRLITLMLAALISMVLPDRAPAADATAGDPGHDEENSPINNSGLPVPRFVSLRSAEVNLRTGPGVRYPVEWVFVRREMPVEITAEFDTWRRIRDWDGTEGWVHQSMLSGKRAIVVTAKTRTLRSDAAASAAPVAQVEAGVIGRLLHCRADWCQVELAGYRGWLQRGEFWGVYPTERID